MEDLAPDTPAGPPAAVQVVKAPRTGRRATIASLWIGALSAAGTLYRFDSVHHDISYELDIDLVAGFLVLAGFFFIVSRLVIGFFQVLGWAARKVRS